MISQQAGLIAVEGGYTLDDYISHDTLAARVAATRPWWEPGTRHGYHSLLMGTIMRELVTRVSGRSTRQFYREEIGDPYDLDFTIGCEPQRRSRISAPNFPQLGEPPPELVNKVADDPIRAAAMARLFPMFETQYEPDVMDADLPAVNGFASARGISQFYAALTTGIDNQPAVLNERTQRIVAEEQASGPDAVLPVDMAFGLGFMVPLPRIPQAGPGSFGHDGAAGALGFANPRLGLSFGWVSDTALSMGADPAATDVGNALVRRLSGERDAQRR